MIIYSMALKVVIISICVTILIMMIFNLVTAIFGESKLRELHRKIESEFRLNDIYNHFGEDTQLSKLREETDELIEAVKENNKEHITEELADVIVMVSQIKVNHSINGKDINKMIHSKIKRTMERIDEGYYDKKEV